MKLVWKRQAHQPVLASRSVAWIINLTVQKCRRRINNFALEKSVNKLFELVFTF